jgi:hypothetical protein
MNIQPSAVDNEIDLSEYSSTDSDIDDIELPSMEELYTRFVESNKLIHQEGRWYMSLQKIFTDAFRDAVKMKDESNYLHIFINTYEKFELSNESKNTWVHYDTGTPMKDSLLIEILTCSALKGDSVSFRSFIDSEDRIHELMNALDYENASTLIWEFTYSDMPIFQENRRFLNDVFTLAASDPSEYVEKLNVYITNVETDFEWSMVHCAMKPCLITMLRNEVAHLKYVRDLILKTFENEEHYFKKVVCKDVERFDSLKAIHNVL